MVKVASLIATLGLLITGTAAVAQTAGGTGAADSGVGGATAGGATAGGATAGGATAGGATAGGTDSTGTTAGGGTAGGGTDNTGTAADGGTVGGTDSTVTTAGGDTAGGGGGSAGGMSGTDPRLWADANPTADSASTGTLTHMLQGKLAALSLFQSGPGATNGNSNLSGLWQRMMQDNTQAGMMLSGSGQQSNNPAAASTDHPMSPRETVLETLGAYTKTFQDVSSLEPLADPQGLRVIKNVENLLGSHIRWITSLKNGIGWQNMAADSSNEFDTSNASGMGGTGMGPTGTDTTSTGSSTGMDTNSDDNSADSMSGSGAPMTLNNDTRLMMMGLINGNLGEASTLRAELGELRGSPAVRSFWRQMIRDHIRSARMIASMNPGLVTTPYVTLPPSYPALGTPRQIVLQTLGAHRATLQNLKIMEQSAAEPQLGLLRRLEGATRHHVDMLSSLRTMAGWNNFNSAYMMRMYNRHMSGNGVYSNGMYDSGMSGDGYSSEAGVSAVGVPTTTMSGGTMNGGGMSGTGAMSGGSR